MNPYRPVIDTQCAIEFGAAFFAGTIVFYGLNSEKNHQPRPPS
jgi:hypothetical protein